MPNRSNPIRIAALCLVLLLVGAQFHYCPDFGTNSSGSHVCQICATAGHAVIAQVLVTDFSPSVSRIESAFYQEIFSSLSFKITSPRAPPSL